MDALFKEAERQGARVKQPDRFTVFFEVSGERVDFKLRDIAEGFDETHV